MRLHIFHKWTKWSEPQQEEWKRQYFHYEVPIGNPIVCTRLSQTRYCKICGKFEKRYINLDRKA